MTENENWAEVGADFADPTYTGVYPPFLYRYRGLSEENWESKLETEIGKRELFLAPFKGLNDPEEGAIDFCFIGTEGEILDFWRKKLKGKTLPPTAMSAEQRTRYILDHGGHPPDDWLDAWASVIENIFRVACFSDDHLNPIMWTHYASFQRASGVLPQGGICLQYVVVEKDFRRLGLAPVEYVNRRPLWNVLEIDSNPSNVRRVMFQKGPAWTVEREWRVFLNFRAEDLKNQAEILNNHSRLRLDEGTISAVIFGLNTPREIKERVAAIVSKQDFRPTLLQIVRDRLSMNYRTDEYR